MKIITLSHRLAIALVAAAVSPLAFAQATTTATTATNTAANAGANAANINATTNAATGIRPVNPAAGTQGTANSTLNSTAATSGVSNSVNGSAAATVGQTGATLNSSGTANTTATGQAAGASVGVGNSMASSMALDSGATTQQIRTSMYETRDNIAGTVESRLTASRQSIANRSNELTGAARVQYDSAVRQAREREAMVRSSLAAVRRASKDDYQAARNQLAQDYDAYATAVAQVDAAGSVPR